MLIIWVKNDKSNKRLVELRKKYPQYEHIAVIIAEDITSRFLNVISLLNGNIPLIAIQLNM